MAQQITQRQKLVASDREMNDHLGFNTHIFDDFAFAGAPEESTNMFVDGVESADGRYMGALYVYKKDTNNLWVEHQKLIGSERGRGHRFGYRMDRSGNTIVVAAHSFGKNYEGAAYVFELDEAGSWTETARLQSSDIEAKDRFGIDVSISGNYIAVGAYGHSKDVRGSSKLKQAGAAYIFKRDSLGNWHQSQKIVSSNRIKDGRFGHEICISEGNLAIGGVNESFDNNGENYYKHAGAIYTYKLDSNGNWGSVQRLTHSDRFQYDNFGWEITITNNELFAGVCHKVVNEYKTAGAVYYFELDEKGLWKERQKLIAPKQAHRDYFGHSLDVYKNLLLVGGGWTDLTGAAYIFKKNDCGYWSLLKEFHAQGEGPEKASKDNFGAYVAISKDHMLIGAPHDANAPGKKDISDAGSTFLYSYSNFDSIIVPCDSDGFNESTTFIDSTVYAFDIPLLVDTPLVTMDSTIVTGTSEDTLLIDTLPLEDTLEIEASERTYFVINPDRNNGAFTIEIIGPNNGPYPVEIKTTSGELKKALELKDRNTTVQLDRRLKGTFLVNIFQGDEVESSFIFVE